LSSPLAKISPSKSGKAYHSKNFTRNNAGFRRGKIAPFLVKIAEFEKPCLVRV